MSVDEESSLRGQEVIWQLMSAFADSMTLKCATELGIADIINSHGAPLTITQIVSGMKDSPSPDMAYLSRIMRYLGRKHIFTVHNPPDGEGEPLYGLNNTSKWLLNDPEPSLKAMVAIWNCPWAHAPWQYLSQCIKEGGTPFEKAHGVGLWDLASTNPEFNKLFNDGMANTAKIDMRAFLEGYKGGFEGVESLVDLGGGLGRHLALIVKANPHIKGINFDLPHVVATAPAYDGVSHVGGSILEELPSADVVLMKSILHNWGDEDCMKILKNCRKAIGNAKRGKLLVVDVVLQLDENKHFGDMGFISDLGMLVFTKGGKERTELEWKKLLSASGFSRYNIIQIAAFPSIIEAFPE